MGGRGNSGVILSQVLRGLSAVVAEADGVDADSAAAALAAATKGAYEAVGDPVEVTNSPTPMTGADGDIYDWTVPWDSWLAMSALHS